MGWQRLGGILPMLILFSIVAATWKAIRAPAETTDEDPDAEPQPLSSDSVDGVADEAGGAVVLESVDEESSVSEAEAESAASDSAIVCDGCTWLVSAESITLRNGQSLCPSCVSALTAARSDQPAPPTPVAVSRGMAPAGSSAKADTRSSPVESSGPAGAVRYRESEKPRRSLSVWRLPLWLYCVFALAT